jgi:hypothetical protein
MEVSFQLHIPGKIFLYPPYTRLGGLQSHSGYYEKDKNLLLQSGTEPESMVF